MDLPFTALCLQEGKVINKYYGQCLNKRCLGGYDGGVNTRYKDGPGYKEKDRNSDTGVGKAAYEDRGFKVLLYGWIWQKGITKNRSNVDWLGSSGGGAEKE